MTFDLLLFHAALFVIIDRPALSLGRSRQQHFLNDLWQRGRIRFHRTGQRIAAEGPESNDPFFGLLAWLAMSALRLFATRPVADASKGAS